MISDANSTSARLTEKIEAMQIVLILLSVILL